MTRPPKITTAPTGSVAPFGLRMLPELKEKIEDAARANGRSMNAEIVARLQESFEGPRLGFGPGSVGQLLIEAEAKAQAAFDRLAAKEATMVEEVSRLVHQRLQTETDAAIKRLRQAATQAPAEATKSKL